MSNRHFIRLGILSKPCLGNGCPSTAGTRQSHNGARAAEFISALPTPDSKEEGEFLVATADGKGVPLKRLDAEKLRACDPPDRPGNRRSAIVAAVYSVDPNV